MVSVASADAVLGPECRQDDDDGSYEDVNNAFCNDWSRLYCR